MASWSPVVLSKPPRPPDEGRLNRHPSFCGVCCNLFAGSALAVFPRSDIFFNEVGGLPNIEHAKSHGTYDETKPVPSWAGVSRLDYTTCQVTARLDDVSSAADEGCSSCAVLHQGLARLGLEAPTDSDKHVELELVFCEGDVLAVYAYWIGAADDDIFGELTPAADRESIKTYEFYTLPGRPSLWPTIGCSLNLEDPYMGSIPLRGGTASHVLSDSSPAAYSQLVSRWLHRCSSSHPLCTDGTQGSTLPKRLIDVQQSDDHNVRLVEVGVDTSPVGCKYVALSHCWGLTQHLRTLTTNMHTFKQEIPWDRLSKTFREAIQMTTSLGMRYIWIDSLCILQDSRRDWEIEAAKMGAIYSQAFLVIAAAGSVDGSGGLFLPKQEPVCIQVEDEAGACSSIFARIRSGHEVFDWKMDSRQPSTDNISQKSSVGYPLLQRAWCYQERLLGRRVLHFTKDELVFECLTSLDCECGTMSCFAQNWLRPPRLYLGRQPPVELGKVSATDTEQHSEIPVKGSTDEEQTRILDQWYDIAAEYSSLSITRSSDWLPALAGMASKWESAATGPYMAGLWSQDILRGLLWIHSSPDTRCDVEYIAPTWSWTCLNRRTRWTAVTSTTSYHVQVDLSHSACVAKGLSRFAELDCGWLSLTGAVARGTLSSLAAENGVGVFKAQNGHETFHPDSIPRCTPYIGQTVFVLKVCTRLTSGSQRGLDVGLLLGSVANQDRDKLPANIRQATHVFKRLSLMPNLSNTASRCHYDETISMYII